MNLGNEIGETVIEERKIRINAFPSSFSKYTRASTNTRHIRYKFNYSLHQFNHIYIIDESVVEIESDREDVKGLQTRMEVYVDGSRYDNRLLPTYWLILIHIILYISDKDEELKKRLQNTKISNKEEEIRRQHQVRIILYYYISTI